MAIKKSDEIHNEVPQEYKILDSDGVNMSEDCFSIGPGVSDIQNAVVQLAYRKFKGWLLRGVSSKGYLARVPGTGDREFVVKVEFSFEFTPFTHATINRAVDVYQNKERKFPPDQME
jgi:hypothetical protein